MAPAANALRFAGFFAQAHLLVLLVFRVTAFEPEHLAVTFVRQDMRTDTIQEPTVVADYYGTSGEVLQTFFKSSSSTFASLLSVSAKCSLFRSPPLSTPHFFSWSAPVKLNRLR